MSFAQPDASADVLMTIERVAALQRVALLQGVAGHELVAVARVAKEVRIASGVDVMTRGDVEDWMFVIVSGRARVTIDGSELGWVGPGDVVGELAVVAPGPRSATVTATEPMLLLRLNSEPFNEMLDDHPVISRAVIASLARKLQANADRQAGST